MSLRVPLLFVVTVPLMGAIGISMRPQAPKDPILELKARVEKGQAKLDFDPKRGYLPAILRELKIDSSSQVLVFSKTSLQSDFVSPETPRAIYFNDHTYVGWIPKAPLIEIMTVDPVRGATFYTIKNQKPIDGKFDPSDKDCRRCHGGRASTYAPNLFANSVYTAPSGYPRVFARTVNATPDVPLRQRWGGWYVSGTHGGQRHLGNELAKGTDEKYKVESEKGANVTDLRRYFDVKTYLTPHSDIVALMVFEQQMHVQNVLTQAGLTARSEPTAIPDAAESLVDALLCVDEVALTSPVKGTGDFARTYAESAPKDGKGRSLSQLDLKTRILAYPCSPLIYSAAFESLPTDLKTATYRRLNAILSGRITDPRYRRLTPEIRTAIQEILVATKPEFATLTR